MVDKKYADTKYADTKYLNTPTSVAAPTGPIAVPQLVRGEDGLMHTIYINPKTGETISDLKGYNIVSSDGGVYKVTAADDENKDGSVNDVEVKKSVTENNPGHTTREDALGHTPGPKATESNNFGYHSKPATALGIAGLVGGIVNPGIGAGIGMLGKAYNVGNMEAVNAARKMLGLSPLTGKQMAKSAMKDNKGQIARVEMGNNQKYSVGFEALSPTGKTNLTPSEAAKRAAMFGMKEVPDDTKKENTFGSKIAKAIGIEPGVATRGLKAIGIEKGWATKALNHITGTLNLPDQAPTPTAKPTARPEDFGEVTPGAANNTPSQKAQGAGLISHPNTPSTPDSEGPANVNYSGIGPGRSAKPNAAFMDGVAKAVAHVLGPTAQVDVTSGTYTQEKQEAINRAREEAAAAGATKAQIDAAGKKAGQVGSTRHTTAKAVDFGASYVDSSGKRVAATPEQMADVASAYAAANPDAGVGIGKGYMDDDGRSRVHLDATGLAGQWGAAGKSANLAQAMKETLDSVRAGFAPTPFSNPATPTPNPGVTPTGFVSQDERAADTGNIKNAVDHVKSQLGLGQVPDNVGAPSVNQTAPEVDRNYAGQGVTPSKSFVSQDEKANTGNITNAPPANNFVSQDERSSLAERTGVTPASLDPVGNSLSPTANNSKVTGPVSAQASVGAKTVANAVQSTNAKLGTTPAAMAAMGLTNRTPQEKAAMAKAIAGELSQSSLAGVKAKDPKALAEMGSMIATMENRASSKKYDTMGKVLGPTQYNSLMAANMATTSQNYATNKKAIDQAMKDYYSGKITGVNYNATNYYNPDVADPAWGPAMSNQTTLGAHKFGSLPEYSGNQAAKDAAKAMGIMAGTDFSPGKAADDNTGYSGTGSSFGGTPGQSSGAGYTPGGMNSPSGSQYGGGSIFGGGGNSSTGGGSGYGGGSAGNGTASGGSAGMSGGGGYSPGGMGSPSGSGFNSPSSSGNNSGLGGPTSNNSGNSGGNKAGGSVGKGGGYSSGASKGSTGGL